MIKNILSFLIIIFPVTLSGQLSCKYLSLRAQQEIDDFPKNYSHCDTFYSVEITQQNGPVFNLDSLERITELYQLKIFGIDSLQSISGLNQLRKVENLHFHAKRKFSPFLSLDTIGSLSYEVAFEEADLTLFQHVKHISAAIRVINDVKLAGLPLFTSKNGFWIDVENNSLTNDISNLIPDNINALHWLWLKGNQNLSLSGAEAMDTIRYIQFQNNKNCNFNFIRDVKKTDYFSSNTEDIIENQYPPFDFVTELEVLHFNKTRNLFKIDSIFPNLEVIKHSISLQANPNLEEIKILDDFPTNWFTPIPGSIIYMVNNPLLADCLSPFICDVLAKFPDEVFMQGNGNLCNKPELIEACITNVNLEWQNELKIFPNPASDILTVESREPIVKIQIISADGRLILSKNQSGGTLDVSELTPGFYFIIVTGKHHTRAKKWEKW